MGTPQTDDHEDAIPQIEHIRAASERIRGHIRQTPILQIDTIAAGIPGDQPASLVFKLEHLQQSGTFKARGAANFMLSRPIGTSGVVAASGGNHGAAVAWAAQRFGHKATIFVPSIASPAKVQRLRAYGATIHQTGAVFADAQAASETFQSQTGAISIHAYNDPVVMAGAGTTALEFQQQILSASEQATERLNTILVACGGGGLAGGTACAVGHDTQIVACETTGTATYASALSAGKPVRVEVRGLGADALGASKLGSNTWLALQRVDALSALLDDEALLEARDYLWNEFRLLVEPAAAAPLAALRSGAYQCKAGERIGVVLCGANTSLGQ